MNMPFSLNLGQRIFYQVLTELVIEVQKLDFLLFEGLAQRRMKFFKCSKFVSPHF
jgi:hypothetical protein